MHRIQTTQTRGGGSPDSLDPLDRRSAAGLDYYFQPNYYLTSVSFSDPGPDLFLLGATLPPLPVLSHLPITSPPPPPLNMTSSMWLAHSRGGAWLGQRRQRADKEVFCVDLERGQKDPPPLPPEPPLPLDNL